MPCPGSGAFPSSASARRAARTASRLPSCGFAPPAARSARFFCRSARTAAETAARTASPARSDVPEPDVPGPDVPGPDVAGFGVIAGPAGLCLSEGSSKSCPIDYCLRRGGLYAMPRPRAGP